MPVDEIDFVLGLRQHSFILLKRLLLLITVCPKLLDNAILAVKTDRAVEDDFKGDQLTASTICLRCESIELKAVGLGYVDLSLRLETVSGLQTSAQWHFRRNAVPHGDVIHLEEVVGEDDLSYGPGWVHVP